MDITVRSLAFYLPQFHRIEENDRWWGRGFTEWTNVTRSTARYPGHEQPRLPADLGFYDLRVAESRLEQAALAASHGVDGFVYYHYWFNGRQLLDAPLSAVLRDGEPSLPFAICWANEDWRATWDGRTGDVLLHQEYGEEDDRAHIRALLPALLDPRYIRVDGRPLLLVYRAANLPDPAATARTWREECRAAGVGEIHLCFVEGMERLGVAPSDVGFDASVEFAPDWELTGPGEVVNGVEVHDYAVMAQNMLDKPCPGYRRHSCVTPGFDNTPRRPDGGYVIAGADPEVYEAWLGATVARDADRAAARGDEEVLVFVNAWNEWAEGAVLEPCQVWGDAFLRAHARVMLGEPPLTELPVPDPSTA